MAWCSASADRAVSGDVVQLFVRVITASTCSSQIVRGAPGRLPVSSSGAGFEPGTSQGSRLPNFDSGIWGCEAMRGEQVLPTPSVRSLRSN